MFTDMSEKVTFKHHRTQRHIERFVEIWGEGRRVEAATELSDGCLTIVGYGAIVDLYCGEEEWWIGSNGDQSGRESHIVIKFEIDNSEIVVTRGAEALADITDLLTGLPEAICGAIKSHIIDFGV